MAYKDRVQETTVSTGTSTITLAGAVTNFVTFSSVFATNETFYYVIAGGTDWETGLGHLSSSTVLVRDNIISSSNSNAVVNLASGTKNVFVSVPGPMIADKGVTLAFINKSYLV